MEVDRAHTALVLLFENIVTDHACFIQLLPFELFHKLTLDNSRTTLQSRNAAFILAKGIDYFHVVHLPFLLLAGKLSKASLDIFKVGSVHVSTEKNLQQLTMILHNNKVLTEASAVYILRKYSDPKSPIFGDAQNLYADLCNRYEGGGLAGVTVTELEMKLTNIRLNGDWNKSVTSLSVWFLI